MQPRYTGYKALTLTFAFNSLCIQEIGLVADSLRLGGAILKVISLLATRFLIILSVLPGDVVGSVGGAFASRD